MASELQVTTLKGNPSGANANKILVPTGQSLLAHGSICQTVESVITTRSTFSVNIRNYVASGLKVTITPKSANPTLIVTANIVYTSANFNVGYVLRDNTAAEDILFNAGSTGSWTTGTADRKKLTSGGIGSGGFNTAAAGVANDFGASSRSVSGLYTPSTPSPNAAREIEVYLCALNSTGTIYLGGNENNDNQAYSSYSYSNIMIQEIVG